MTCPASTSLSVYAVEDKQRYEWEVEKYLPTGIEYQRESNEVIFLCEVKIEPIAGEGDPGDPGA